MHIRHLILPFLIASASAASSGDINAFVGMKIVPDDKNPTSNEAWGICFDIRDQSWPVYAAINYFGTHGSEDSVTEMTQELQGGFKWYLGEDAMRAWVGGGLSFIYVDAEIPSSSDSDIAPGLWGAIGVTMTVNDQINLGFSYAYSWSEVELFGTTSDVGGHTFGFQAGYRW